MPDRTVRTAVLPVAGLGTRFLPATKAIPKEALPVVDRPALQYVVEECVRAGIDDVLLVTARGKEGLTDHFDRAPELEAALKEKGLTELLTEVTRVSEMVTVHTIRQPAPLGLGHAVLMARDHVVGDGFVVALGDDLVGEDEPLMERMLDAFRATGRAVVALMEVPHDEVYRYGIATAAVTDDGWYAVTDLVEKPPVEEAPSNLAVIGRYVLPAEIFEVLAETPPGAGGEIQLTDALRVLAADEPIVGVLLEHSRFDIGDKLGFLKATVQFAVRRDDLGPEFAAWLVDYVKELP